jgi:acetoin utilization protein AcuB
MLVKEVMSPHPVVIEPNMPVTKAQQLMKEDNIRHLPVVHKKKGLVGLITRDALNRALPSELTSLAIWEINYQLSRIKVKDVMVKRVLTVSEEVTVEQAARIMIRQKVGSLPVLRDGELVGIVTDIDLMAALTNLMAWRQPGVRATVQVPDERGWLAKVATAVAGAGGLIAGGGAYASPEPLKANIVLKVRHVPPEELRSLLEGIEGLSIVDIRESPEQA